MHKSCGLDIGIDISGLHSVPREIRGVQRSHYLGHSTQFLVSSPVFLGLVLLRTASLVTEQLAMEPLCTVSVVIETELIEQVQIETGQLATMVTLVTVPPDYRSPDHAPLTVADHLLRAASAQTEGLPTKLPHSCPIASAGKPPDMIGR